jgi:hypothetical protein
MRYLKDLHTFKPAISLLQTFLVFHVCAVRNLCCAGYSISSCSKIEVFVMVYNSVLGFVGNVMCNFISKYQFLVECAAFIFGVEVWMY